MRVVPEGTGLILGLELVEERVAWRNGALRDSSRSVGPLGSLLKETMPMLHDVSVKIEWKRKGKGIQCWWYAT
jgi:hypothetical protein